jgi:sugar lactone lactonase YvrE
MGSVTQRRIIALGPDRAARDLVASAADGIAGVFGMAVEADRRTLWVATTALGRMSGFTPADSGRAGVFGYDLDTGTLRRRVWLGRDALPHTLGDVAVAPNGDVYVSDSQSPWILKVPAAGDTLERFMTHPSFRSLQGLAVAADGGTMYVADYSHGLFRIDLTRRTAQAVRVPPGVTTLGIDGLYLHDGALVAVQNGIAPARVVRFCLDASGDAVRRAELLDRSPALADEPALGAVVGDSVFYIGTSQWEKFDDAGRRLPGTTARPATVIGVSLRTPTGCRTS